MTVFCFKVWYDGDMEIPLQRRYVVAETEEEAIDKLEAYAEMMEEQGVMHLNIIYEPTVEIDNVIA